MGVSKSYNNTNSSYDTSLANPFKPNKRSSLHRSLLDDSSNNSSSYNSCNNSSSSYSDSSVGYSISSSTDSSSAVVPLTLVLGEVL